MNDNLLRLTEHTERIRIRYQHYRTRRGWGLFILSLPGSVTVLLLLSIAPRYAQYMQEGRWQEVTSPLPILLNILAILGVGLILNECVGWWLRYQWHIAHSAADSPPLRKLGTADLPLMGVNYALSADGELTSPDDDLSTEPAAVPPLTPSYTPHPNEAQTVLAQIQRAQQNWLSSQARQRLYLSIFGFSAAVVTVSVLAHSLMLGSQDYDYAIYNFLSTLNCIFVPQIIVSGYLLLANTPGLYYSRARKQRLQAYYKRHFDPHKSMPVQALQTTQEEWFYNDEPDHQPPINTQTSADGR